MDETEILRALTEIFRTVFRRDDLILQPRWTASDIDGWDSFRQIEIIVTAEARFAIKMTTRDLDALRSVGDLIRVIQARTGG
jgi:acyl carrier protein